MTDWNTSDQTARIEFDQRPYFLEEIPPRSRFDGWLKDHGLRRRRYRKRLASEAVAGMPTITFTNIIECWSLPEPSEDLQRRSVST